MGKIQFSIIFNIAHLNDYEIMFQISQNRRWFCHIWALWTWKETAYRGKETALTICNMPATLYPVAFLNHKIPHTSFPSLCGIDELCQKDTVHSTNVTYKFLLRRTKCMLVLLLALVCITFIVTEERYAKYKICTIR